ncbi:cobalt-precorrin-5B C(1)-methyltransferase [Paenibacillus baekrokdamisoli]|uniref:Cobalt-precorrin-5B C(1)-methyltransferase n=1 Tax=Paenibacillus baekrokdamisoli TaxID=1712516 RepID=A0A3G9JB24_9BACL|nr:cobalt-precorrin-5B (C(1))-methyltransferase [Paenibacillus baekrokdamisoli]MBB3072424.1 cobalt-precorrin-5B (C1)-methyltransferase [Paenibacillus baekrokdamisoli]BBH20484.1 cobalt-precorrin-5B C(1)-methyltransferase [Paenibacillus baekrokdamisoli]
MSDVIDTETKPLRHGYTTGACATATAKAALTMLITQMKLEESEIWLPAGFFHTFELIECEITRDMAQCATIKDGGDDPDATHKAKIVCTVTWSNEAGIELDGGIGVGRVTKPGLPVEVGQAAINPVPRRMILKAVQEVLEDYEVGDRGVRVVISVPDGEEMAKKTLNARLGIIGGISILGTRGTVVPFSTAAYKASIIQALLVARASECRHVVLTTGGSSEKYAMKLHPELPEEAFIQMGDFVGFSLKHAKRLSAERISLVGMMGKFSKVAQGVMMVHSKSAPVDFDFLADVAGEAGCPDSVQQTIKEANTASQAADLAIEAGVAKYFELLCRYASEHAVNHVEGGVIVDTALVTMKGELLGRAEIVG